MYCLVPWGARVILNRWLVLAVLFFARFTMAFQFQSIVALLLFNRASKARP